MCGEVESDGVEDSDAGASIGIEPIVTLDHDVLVQKDTDNRQASNGTKGKSKQRSIDAIEGHAVHINIPQ